MIREKNINNPYIFGVGIIYVFQGFSLSTASLVSLMKFFGNKNGIKRLMNKIVNINSILAAVKSLERASQIRAVSNVNMIIDFFV